MSDKEYDAKCLREEEMHPEDKYCQCCGELLNPDKDSDSKYCNECLEDEE